MNKNNGMKTFFFFFDKRTNGREGPESEVTPQPCVVVKRCYGAEADYFVFLLFAVSAFSDFSLAFSDSLCPFMCGAGVRFPAARFPLDSLVLAGEDGVVFVTPLSIHAFCTSLVRAALGEWPLKRVL